MKIATYWIYQSLFQLSITFCFQFLFRMDAIPSAHLRQQKLEHQRQLIEQKQKQKRQAVRIRSLGFLVHFIVKLLLKSQLFNL